MNCKVSPEGSNWTTKHITHNKVDQVGVVAVQEAAPNPSFDKAESDLLLTVDKPLVYIDVVSVSE